MLGCTLSLVSVLPENQIIFPIDQRVQWFPDIAGDENAADPEANDKNDARKDEDHKCAAHEGTSTKNTEAQWHWHDFKH